MKYFVLKMTPEQDLLLAKHLGEMKHFYSLMLKMYKEEKHYNEEMQQFYQKYLDEVEELIDLLFTVFKNEVNNSENISTKETI